MKIVKFLPAFVVLVFLGIVAFGATAFAATAATGTADSSSLLDLLKPVFDAFSGGHYAFAAALLVIALAALVKRYFGDKIKFLHTDAGGSLLALVVATASALATTLAPGAPFSFGLLKSALLVGVGAAGGYSMLKALLVDPILVPYLSKRSWGAPVLLVINFIFSHGAAAAQTEATAAAAGAAAVTAKPATGVTGATGAQPTELK